MYKITYLLTGNTFELPDDTARELKSKFPNEYKILEKNGKKFNDRVKKSDKEKTVYERVVVKE